MLADESRRLESLATEKANPLSGDLDLLSTSRLLEVLHLEDQRAVNAVGAVCESIAVVIDAAVPRLARGGTLHYFGAGTSGRLGVLDAAEIPPTFGTDPATIQGHLAGGEEAMFRAKEGAEDSFDLGAADARASGLKGDDVVFGISASGRTPYALGALEAARHVGALTIALVCNAESPMQTAADLSIVPLTGEEVLSGSTRLKAGTAQKLVLNMVSTSLMIRLGKTYGNLMVGVQATNEKLRERARRLTGAITGRSDGVEESLKAAGFDVRLAVLLLSGSPTLDAARRRLAAAGGSLRRALSLPNA